MPPRLHRRRHGQRGSALLVAMIVILSMTALGLMAITTAIVSTRTSGNYRDNKQSEWVGESGWVGGLARIGCIGDALIGYPSYMMFSEDDFSCNATETIGFGDTESGFFGIDPFGIPTRGARFIATTSEPTPARRAPGYDEGYCYMSITLTAEGMTGSGDGSGMDVLARSLWRGYAYVGPVQCPGS